MSNDYEYTISPRTEIFGSDIDIMLSYIQSIPADIMDTSLESVEAQDQLCSIYSATLATIGITNVDVIISIKDEDELRDEIKDALARESARESAGEEDPSDPEDIEPAYQRIDDVKAIDLTYQQIKEIEGLTIGGVLECAITQGHIGYVSGEDSMVEISVSIK